MKITKPLVTLALVALLASPLALARGNRGNRGPQGGGQGSGSGCLHQILQDLPYQELDDAESADLVFNREEEKLARDVIDPLFGELRSPADPQ